MDIHIVHDGAQRGPFTEEAVHAMLKDGSVLLNDLGWRPGLSAWVPVINLLYPAAAHAPAPGGAPPLPSSGQTQPVHAAPAAQVTKGASFPTETTPAPASSDEPATERQKALLTYMAVPFSSNLTREAASRLVAEVMENPGDPDRLAKWNRERLHLHPDLFAAELQARKESRSQQYFEICQKQGGDQFQKVTKAHCQVLVGYLDVKFPNWDADERDAAESYFFPAVAEKFPQLLTSNTKGKYKYPGGPKVAPEITGPTPVRAVARPRRALPIGALARGVFFGLLVLGLIWGARKVINLPPVARAGAATPTPISRPGGESADLVKPPKPVVKRATPEPDAEPSATGGTPPPAAAEVASSNPAMAAPSTPPENATMPPAPAAPPPAADPAAKPSLFTMDLPANPASTGGGAGELIPGSPARSTLILTKPVEIALAYGKIKLQPGTPVKLLQQTGDNLKIQYLNNTATIPASSTNLGTEPAAPPAPAPAGGLPPSPAATPPPLPAIPGLLPAPPPAAAPPAS